MRGHFSIALGLAILGLNPGIVVAQEVPAAGPPKVEGARIGVLQARNSIIDNIIPERTPIFPDDPNSAVWEVNPSHAFALAQRQQRPLLLLFTGDWHEKCQKLSQEVFTTKSFNDFAKENVIICFLNFPQNRSDAHPTFRQWKEKFKVVGYPKVLVFNPDGEVVQEIGGYTVGKPVSYFNELKSVVMPVVAVVEERKTELRKIGFRDWTNDEGVSLFARFVRHGGELVTLQGANQVFWTIEIAALSEEDQNLVKSFPAIEEIANGGPVTP